MVEVKEALLIGYLVAVFLLSSSCIRRAIAIFKECLVLLKDKALKEETELVRSMYEILYLKSLKGTFQSMMLQMLWNAVESSWS